MEKERTLKAAEEKQQVTYKGKPIEVTADFSTRTLNAREDMQRKQLST
jgi:hypothetical protein